MALQLSAKFLEDIQTRDTALTPVVLISNLLSGGSEGVETVWDDPLIYISTGAHTSYLPFPQIQDFYGTTPLPLLLNIPSLKETINISTRKYSISNITLNISNLPYNGTRFSELVGDKSLINVECRVFWLSPSATSFHGVVDAGYEITGGSGEESSGERLQIYYGSIRRYTHDHEKVTLVVEDKSQSILHKTLPASNLGVGAGIPDKYKNKPIPMVFGHVDRSPCVITSPIPTIETVGEENLTVQVDNIPVDLTNTGIYIYEDNYYQIEKLQDYDRFGLHNVYKNGTIENPSYTHSDIDNKIILKLSEGTDITAFADNNAHVRIEPKIQTVSAVADTSDDVINDTNGHGFVEGTNLTDDVIISGIDDFILDQSTSAGYPLQVSGKAFLIDIGATVFSQNIKILFSMEPISQSILNQDVFVANELPIRPLFFEIPLEYINNYTDPLGTIHATKFIGQIRGSDGHVFTTLLNYDMSGPNFNMILENTEIQGDYTFLNFTDSEVESFSIMNNSIIETGELTSLVSHTKNHFVLTFSPSSNYQAINFDIRLNNPNILYDIFIKDVFKSHIYADVKGRAMQTWRSPNLIEVINNIVITELGYTDIDTPTAPYYGWEYAFTINKSISSKKLIEELASVSPFIPRFDNMGKFTYNFIKEEYQQQDISETIYEADVIDFSFSRTPIESVYSKIVFKYNFDYAKKEFNGSVEATSDLIVDYDPAYYGFPTEEGKIHSESTLIIDDDRGKYIRTESTAQAFADWFLMWSANQHLKIKVKLPLRMMILEIGSIVSFDKIIGGDVYPYGIDYTQDHAVNKQKVQPYFMVVSTNKTIEFCEIEVIQMHQLFRPEDTSLIVGCMVEGACNYNSDATDPGDCVFPIGYCWNDNWAICPDESCIPGTNCSEDCIPPSVGEDDCESGILDCFGICNGPAVEDCNNECNGQAYIDPNCGDCVGGNTGEEPCITDCNDTFDGSAVQHCMENEDGTPNEDYCCPCDGGYPQACPDFANTGEFWCSPDGSSDDCPELEYEPTIEFLKIVANTNEGSGTQGTPSGSRVDILWGGNYMNNPNDPIKVKIDYHDIIPSTEVIGGEGYQDFDPPVFEGGVQEGNHVAASTEDAGFPLFSMTDSYAFYIDDMTFRFILPAGNFSEPQAITAIKVDVELGRMENGLWVRYENVNIPGETAYKDRVWYDNSTGLVGDIGLGKKSGYRRGSDYEGPGGFWGEWHEVWENCTDNQYLFCNISSSPLRNEFRFIRHVGNESPEDSLLLYFHRDYIQYLRKDDPSYLRDNEDYLTQAPPAINGVNFALKYTVQFKDNYHVIEYEGDTLASIFVADPLIVEFELTGCPSPPGDINGDGIFNVLDIVGLANCVLGGYCADLGDPGQPDGHSCAADVSGDNNYNVLDVVQLANCVLCESCPDDCPDDWEPE